MKSVASFACAALVAMSAFAAGAASNVTWTGTPLTSSSTSIRTDGTLKYAYARGNYTANGVEFVGVGDKIINTENCVVWEASGGAGTSGATAPGDTESGGYMDMLQHPWWASAKGRKIQLNNLEVGEKYLVQMIAFRNDYTTQTATAPDGVAVIHYGGTGWEYGGSLSAEFTADAATEEFTISYSGQALINGIQVRELSESAPGTSGGVIIVN